ncbi:hypothetical protein [Sulfolobus islandicus rod-shaped virus 2]|uniref:Uncharacterized protein n=1 Tax=Sulfolobus islandicus rod-shaped virus 2 TaxID=157899 RepID=Q8V9M1_SIRV2|nr:hypothetical protein SIRV2gp48 [Sulfolobus islandicus rod-shaped virus 2]CAC87323.1 hypothetical protein [Sulfolobus islandicus rod-shaped virus 2]
MEVKQIKKLNNLPWVFLDTYLNKFALDKNFVNCAYYSSRSGMTQEGCVQVMQVGDNFKVDTMREVHGIYFTPHASIISLIYRQKGIRSIDDLKEILGSLNLSKVSPKHYQLLVKYSNYTIEIYDIYFKGHIYEFPLVSQQGHLNVYNVPEPRNVYLIYYENNEEKKELNKDLFNEVSEFMIYNHRVTFEKPVLEFKNLQITPGGGALVYVPESMYVKLESSDHQSVEFRPSRDDWLLFSHPRPRRSGND